MDLPLPPPLPLDPRDKGTKRAKSVRLPCPGDGSSPPIWVCPASWRLLRPEAPSEQESILTCVAIMQLDQRSPLCCEAHAQVRA